MKSREEFKQVVENTADLAKHLQMVFPDVRDAMMSLAMILAGLAKSADIPLERIILLVSAVYSDMKEDEISTTNHEIH